MDMEKQPFADLYDGLAQARRRFLDEVAPLRPDLFRYAIGLTGSTWDAEDLVQEALTRAFANLGKFERVRNLRAYVFRIATNAWLDARRRRQPMEIAEGDAESVPDPAEPIAPVEWREALEFLLQALPTRARAAVLLRDVLGFTESEAAEALRTTGGAVKAALSRGRSALRSAGGNAMNIASAPVDPQVVEAFATAMQARDIDGLLALVAPEATTEVVGIYTDTGIDAARNVIARTVQEAEFTRAALVEYQGERIVVLWYRASDGTEPVVGDIVRLETENGSVTRYRSYYYAPEVLGAVGRKLELPVRTQGCGPGS